MGVNSQDDKFRVKADLALFQAIQQDGRLSEQSIAQITNIPATTVHYAMQRIRQRDFFHIKAVPKLHRFKEIPMAIAGFSNVRPLKIQTLKDRCINKAEVVQFFHSQKDVLLFVMDTRMDKLTENLFDIMEHLGEKPCLYITSPIVAKSNAAIPDRILKGVYADVLDKKNRG